METAIQDLVSRTELLDISDAITDEMNWVELNVNTIIGGWWIFEHIGVIGRKPNSRQRIGYVVMYDILHGVRVKGPSPSSSNGKTAIDALINNIEETLYLRGFHYDEKAGMYIR